MELNITFTELMLFCWAILATAAAIKFKDEAYVAKKLLVIFIHDEGARAQILKANEDFTKKVRELRGEQ